MAVTHPLDSLGRHTVKSGRRARGLTRMGAVAGCAAVVALSACTGGGALRPTSSAVSPSPTSTSAQTSTGPTGGAAAGTGSPAVTPNGVVSWVHIGDLHIQTADMANYADLKSALGEISGPFAGGVNFAVLPGDNANEGSDAEYALIHQAIVAAHLGVPLYAIRGDHDLKSTTSAFTDNLAAKTYYSQDVGGYHFVFLDAMGNTGAASLTAGSAEMTWFAADLKAAASAGKASVLVMHPYFLNSLPDLTDFQALVQANHVIMIDSGHTHTNQLANDGHIIYAATRSTGQLTEGPAGVSISSLDHGIVSWKFDPLGTYPFVEITSPADQPLLTSAAGIAHGTTTIDAKAFSTSKVATARYQLDGGAPISMSSSGGDLWSASWDTASATKGTHKLTVTVTDAAGKTASDTITAVVDQADTYNPTTKSFGPGDNLLLATNPDIAAKGVVSTSASSSGPGPGGPGGAGPGGPGGPGGRGGPHGTATVTTVVGNTVTLKFSDGTTSTVTVGSTTQILRQVPATISDLKPGVSVQLTGPPGGPSALVLVSGAPSTAAASTSSTKPASAIRSRAHSSAPWVLALGATVGVVALVGGATWSRRRRT